MKDRKVVAFGVALLALWQHVPLAIAAQSSRTTLSVSSSTRSVQQAAIGALEAQSSSSISVRWNSENQTPVDVIGLLTPAGTRNRAASPEAAAVDFLRSEPTIFGLIAPAAELRLIKQTTDDLGETHVLFDRVYRGLRVFPSQLAVHFSRDGAITRVNGRYHPSFDLNINPTTTSAEAVKTCQAALAPNAAAAPRTELFVFAVGNLLRLAWEVSTPLPSFPKYRFVVDATDGQILIRDPGVIR
jgi:bacillolysin